jgi:Flp pilus assembly protein TadD
MMRHAMAMMAWHVAKQSPWNRLMRIFTGFSLGLILAIGGLPLAGCESLPKTADLSGTAPGTSLVGAPPPGPQAKPEDDPGRSEGMLRLAADIEGRGEKGTALTFYERAAAASNGDPGIHLKVGDAFLRMGYPVNAANAYRVVLEKAPGNGRAMLGLGSALARGGDVEGGLAYLAKAAPAVNTAAAYDRLGLAHIMIGQPREALASFEQAYAMDKGDIDIATNLALAAALAGQHDRAIELMKSVARRPNAGPQHKRNLVLVMGIGGKGTEAKASVTDLPPDLVQSLLAQASSIRGMSSAKARALALGSASTATN